MLGPPAPVSRIAAADVWLDLLAQRPSAVVHAGGRLVADFGHVRATIHTDLTTNSPWMLGEDVQGQSAGVIRGKGATFVVPLDGPLAPGLHRADDGSSTLGMAIDLLPLAPADGEQSMTVLVNEHVLANLRLSSTWQRRTFTLPAEMIHPGDNRIRLHFRHTAPRGEDVVSAAVRTVEVGPVEQIREGPPPNLRGSYRIVPTDNGVALELHRDSSWAYYLQAPRRGYLRVAARGRGKLVVRVSTDADHRAGTAPVELASKPLRPTGQEFEVDLSGHGDVPIRLEIAVEGSGDDVKARIEGLDVVVNRSTPQDRRPRQLRNVYIVAIEGARPSDLLRLHQNPGGRPLPAVERMVREGMVFERAYTLAPWAIPSHAGWLSSSSPMRHKTLRGTYVADGVTLLPEVLDRAGYYTLVVTANADFNVERGLTQGVDHILALARGSSDGNDATAVLKIAEEQLVGKPKPRFVYLNVNDPQAPYDPPREAIEHLDRPNGDDVPLPHLTHLWIGKVRLGKSEPSAAARGYVHDLYRGELEVVDQALGMLLSQLEQRGELDESIVMLMGLHGEEFYEHGGAGHGFTLYEESLRVPLVIRAPSLLAPGRVRVPVDLMDLAPTIVDLLGLELPPAWEGTSLLQVVDDPNPPPHMTVAVRGDGSRAVVVGHHKLIYNGGRGPDAQQLFDLRADPTEQKNLVTTGRGGVALRVLRTSLIWELAFESQWKRARWGSGVHLLPAFALDHGM